MSSTEAACDNLSLIRQRFTQLFGGTARVFRAPGRVNLIGEHTDYNDGFVMPAAISFSTLIAAGLRDDNRLCVYSEKFSETEEWDLASLAPGASGHWSDYVRGVAGVLQSRGHKLRGSNLVIQSSVPVGSGLSSSAAIEVATAFALLGVSGLQIPGAEIALICQQAEHEYAGARVGIMDQFISVHGRKGHALLLDCRSLSFELLAVPPGAQIVICDSRVKHAVSGGEYNQRRAACEIGVVELSKSLPGVKALRDVTPEQLEAHKAHLPDLTYRRCRHVVTEIDRTLRAADALKAADLQLFGRLMYESHRSLRDDYEVSCRELDILVESARQIEGVYGARMTGAGFGGCTVNIVNQAAVPDFRIKVAADYKRAVGVDPNLYVSDAAQGAGECI
ncbi:MAG TPA: galactokinase [Terriglobales bacterium]|nr:galactokinase [Terriglobales bacterium]